MAASAFDWSQYLALAEELGARHDETALRSSISRAYYCVYHLALTRAEANFYKPERGESTHAQLWRVFSGSPDPSCKRLALIADRLKEKRVRADYNDFYARIAEEVPTLLQDARDFAALLAAVPPRLPSPTSIRR
jgi:uncharacterized protein (UPF0332 family)